MDGVTSVSVGTAHTMIIKTDGSLWACGWNYMGQFGDGTNVDRHTPVMIAKGSENSTKLTLSANPSGGQVEKGTKVILTAKATGSTVSADIYYTTNGTTPTKYSTKYTTSGITINEACTLKAIAYKDGYETSDVLPVDIL